MEKVIFENKVCPFTVPDGYFDTLQERIMSRIQEGPSFPLSRKSTNLFRTLLAAAACVAFIFTAAALYSIYAGKQSMIAESIIDENFYQWSYAADNTTLLAESLNIAMPEMITANGSGFSEEDEAIIRFLERDNINLVAAIIHSIDNAP